MANIPVGVAYPPTIIRSNNSLYKYFVTLKHNTVFLLILIPFRKTALKSVNLLLNQVDSRSSDVFQTIQLSHTTSLIH